MKLNNKVFVAFLSIAVVFMIAGLSWFIWYMSVIPRAIVPQDAKLIIHRPDDGTKFYSAISSSWYGEQYIINDTLNQVVDFYISKDATCSEIKQQERSSYLGLKPPYWRCYGKADPFGRTFAEFKPTNPAIENNDIETEIVIMVEVRWDADFSGGQND